MSIEAREDFDRLFDHVLDRELAREDGDIELAQEAIMTIRGSLSILERFPYVCRKADSHPLLRELVIPQGRTGYVALFEIMDDETVLVAAVRYQREDDYH